MSVKIKQLALAALMSLFSPNTHAQTNLLQGVTVAIEVFRQGPTNTSATGTNHIVDHYFLKTKDLIKIVSVDNTFHNGDILARATPVVLSATNDLGTASWVIYNPKSSPPITPISTNVYFDIHTARAYGDGTNRARLHGETITRNNVIRSGTTDQIRRLVLSNATWQVSMQGYAHGHFVPISLGGANVVASQDFNWSGNGSGTSTNAAIVVLVGDVSEDYFKFLK